MKINNRVEYIYAAEMEYVFESYFGNPLLREGFKRIGVRKWIRRKTNEIFDVFQIQALKGMKYSPLWGFSLSYVPIITNDNLLYKIPEKAPKLDYRYDPLDIDFDSGEKKREWIISRLNGPEKAKINGELSAGKSIPLALALFSEINEISDLSQLYEKSLQAHKSKIPHRFGFFNYIQFPIAYAFTLAHLGRYKEGVAILQEAIHRGYNYGSAYEKLLIEMKKLAEKS